MTDAPTSEQEAIVAAFQAGHDVVVEAGAGTGKTSTLALIARSRPGGRGIYVAYNRAIATDAARRFPAAVTCSTAHGLAYRAIGRQYAHRLKAARMPAARAAEILGLSGLQIGGEWLPPKRVARLALETVDRFCRSADPAIDSKHVPRVLGLTEPGQRAALSDAIPPLAERAWRDLTRTDGRLRFDHDVYLKLWQLSGPKLACDYVLLDEAQDADPAVADVVRRQHHAQRVLVGDRQQAIYGWRGAVDAMSSFEGRRLLLSQSFRFGEAVATEANRWLRLLGSDLRLRGLATIPSRVQTLANPDAILCRSNAEAVARVMAAQRAGRRAALVGGGNEIRRLAEAAITLKAGRGTEHPELFAFRTWADLVDYVDHDPAGADLRRFVRLVDAHGPDAILAATNELADEQRADVVVSTAHRAKGREWEAVQIASDFYEPRPTEENPEPELKGPDMMLAYVSVTRARLVLDRQGLAWVDNWLTRRTRIEGAA